MSSKQRGASKTDMEEMKEEGEGGWVLVERDLPWENSKRWKLKKLGHVEETSCEDSDQGQAESL